MQTNSHKNIAIDQVKPPRGQQKEWALALSLVPDRDTRKALDIAHNAAIAALKSATESFTPYFENQELKQQLTAERQRREQADKLYHALLVVSELQAKELGKVSEQLLSALAAIEKHNRSCRDSGNFAAIGFMIETNLAALHEHDAEVEQKVLAKACSMISERNERDANRDAKVREPLVGCLRRLINELPTRRDWLDPDLEKFARGLLRENDALAKIKK